MVWNNGVEIDDQRGGLDNEDNHDRTFITSILTPSKRNCIIGDFKMELGWELLQRFGAESA